MAKLVTYVIRDASGKLAATYNTASSTAGKDVPQTILEKFYTSTQMGPNGPLGRLKSGYIQDMIVSVEPNDFYKTETEVYKQEKAKYEKIYSDIQKEAQERRVEEAARLARAEIARNQAAADVNVKNRFLAHTTGNPFVAPGAREISRRKAKSAVAAFNSSQFELGDAIDSHNALIFEGAFDTYNKESELRKHNYDKGLYTYGGYDNRLNDYSTAKLFSISEQPVKTEAQINQEKYNEIRPAYRDSRSGLQITGLENIPNKLTREQSQQVNKSLIAAQLPAIIDNKILSKIQDPTTYARQKEKISNFLNPIPQAYAETYDAVITSPDGSKVKQSGLTKAELETIEKVNKGKAIVKYTVSTPDGTDRIFNSKENAEKFAERYGKKEGVAVAGSLGYIFGESKPVQGPQVKEDVFFVGANAQGYKTQVDRTQPTKPLQTGIEIIDRPKTQTEQFLEGVSRPFTNLASAVSDFGKAIDNSDFTSPKPFTEPNNPFGLPVPRIQTPTKTTASSELFEGKVPNITDLGILGSAVGEGALIAFGLKTPKIATKVKTGIEGEINLSKVKTFARETNEGVPQSIERVDSKRFIVDRGTELNPAKNPLSLFNFASKTKTLQNVRSEPIKNALPNEVIITGDLDVVTAKAIGATQTGKKSFDLNPLARLALRGAEERGKIVTKTDAINFNKDVFKSARPSEIQAVTNNPADERLAELVTGGKKFDITRYAETGNIGFQKQRGFVGGSKSEGGIGVGSKGLDRKLAEVGLSYARNSSRKFNKKPSTPFDNNIKSGFENYPARGQLTETTKKVIKDEFKATVKETPKQSLTSLPLLPVYAEQQTVVYPISTPQSIKDKVKSVNKSDVSFGTTSRFFNRYGLETIGVDNKLENRLKEIPIQVTPQKERQSSKVIPIQFSISSQIQTPITKIVPIQETIITPILETPTITKTIIDIPLETPPTRPPPPFKFGEFGFAFPGFGGQGGNRNPRKKYKKKYLVNSIDPETPGSIETAGLPVLRVSRSKNIYNVSDSALRKQRKKNQPKGKRNRYSISDPF